MVKTQYTILSLPLNLSTKKEIPLVMNFDCEIWIDTQLTSLKIEQAIIEAFYKTITFYIYYK